MRTTKDGYCWGLVHLIAGLCAGTLAADTARSEVSSSSPPPPAADAAWSAQMREIHKAYGDLLPTLTSDKRFRDPKNSKALEKSVQRFAELADKLKTLKMPADFDPSTTLLAELFAEEARRGLSELRKSNKPYARQVLNSIPNLCVSCHTRSATGPDLSKPGIAFLVPQAALTPVEKARYLAATRQYRPALEEYRRIFHFAPTEGDTMVDWERGVRSALAIAIRVEKDPATALAIVNEIMDRGFVARHFKDDLFTWKKSLEDWKAEPTREATAATEAEALTELRRLHMKAKELQLAPKDRSADVLYHRLIAAAHEFLRKHPDSADRGEALLLLGVSYEVMQDIELSTFHELIYETCVRRTGASETAKKCFRRYQASIAEDYLGRTIPRDVQARIQELRRISGTSD